MKPKRLPRIPRYFAWISIVVAVGIAPATMAQEEQAPGEDELRSRLERLEKELVSERAALEEARASMKKELEERKAARRELAGRLLEGKIALERLKKRNEKLEIESEAVDTEAGDLRAIRKRVLTGFGASAERLDIHLRECPSGQRYRSRARKVLKDLPGDIDSAGTERFPRDLHVLMDLLDRAHGDSAALRVQRMKLRTAGGLQEEVKLLSAGNVAFAYETLEGNRVGLALSSPADASGYRWTEKLADSVSRAVRQALRNVDGGATGVISVPMDVTRRLRLDALLPEEGLAERLGAGGVVMFPLAAVAILALLIIVERFVWLYFRNMNRAPLTRRVLASCNERKYDEAERLASQAKGVVSRTLAACLRRRDQGTRAMEDGIQEQLLHELPRLRRFLAGLAILAAVAPLLGLLGTVTGIIHTFGVIRAFGNANPSLMAGGISEALITTAAGLVIAIPILLCRGLLRGRMEKILGDAERHAATLLNVLSRNV